MKQAHIGENISLWQSEEDIIPLPTLTQDLQTDVCIIGGGIAGLTSAYLLSQWGKRVCVLEGFEIGSGQTGKTTAQLSTALDDRYFNIEKYHSIEKSRLAAESHRAAIHKVQEIVGREKINCDMEKIDGYLFALGDPRKDVLQKELLACRRAGLTEVNYFNQSPTSSFLTGPCLHFPNQMQLHPLKYLNGLTSSILKNGAQVYTNSMVNQVSGGKNAKNAFVTTRLGYTVHCQDIIVATNTPFNDLFALHTKQSAYRTYVLGFKIPKGYAEKALFWDTLDPYHYVRFDQKQNYDLLIVGGEDHKTGQDPEPSTRFEKLAQWTRSHFSYVQDILFHWSGQVMEPVDSLAFLGHNPMDEKNVYVISGDSGNGMTHATIGALLITDQILGIKNPWEDLYSPNRKNLKTTKTFLQENLNVVAQYADWISPAPRPDFKDLDFNEGLVYRDGLRPIAAYKNPYGHISLYSAVCPHLKGIVRWNQAEKSWDCPCHGSRFDCYGEVIEGPAFQNLLPITDSEEVLSHEQNFPDLLPEI